MRHRPRISTSRGLTLVALLTMACLLAVVAHAEPGIVEPGWTLIRTIPFENPIAAHFNPVDGRIYLACRETDADGLYRIDGLGFSAQVAAGTYLASVVVDPQTGAIYSADSLAGLIYRTELGASGREQWVTGFHSGDDDPMGMAIAPLGYSGSVLTPGQALVVDQGYSGPDEIWLWSPAVAEGEVLLHADDGTLIEALDIAIGPETIHLVDAADASPGVIYEVGPEGVLTPLPTLQPLPDPHGITYDPDTGDLLVLDATDDRLVRVDPTTGAVSDVLTGIPASSAWAGVDITADGRQLVVSAFDADEIYVLARCDADGHPELDCDDNGVYDACDIAAGAPDCNRNGIPDSCDLASGASDDCNLDGVPDDCPDCPPVEVVFIMDTSTSMDDEAAALCGSVNQVVAWLEAADLDVRPQYLSICNLPGGAYGCLDNQIDIMLGTAVPGSPPPGLEVLGDCTGYLEACSEDWGTATAVVAGLYPWLPSGESVRVIIPLSDEGPRCGDPVAANDQEAITHAIAVARASEVIVSPVTGTGSSSTVQALAQALADSTGGLHFNSTTPSLDIAESIVDLVLAACATFTDCNANGTLDECDIADGTSEDLDGNGIPDECEAVIGVEIPDLRSEAFGLAQNAPNPFNPSTTIVFDLPRDTVVDLSVFALDGRRVTTLAQGPRQAGRHAATWAGRDDQGRRVSSGTYVYRLRAGEVTMTRTMVLLK